MAATGPRPEEAGAFLGMVSDLLAVFDDAGAFLWCNAAWGETLGVPVGELVGSCALDRVHQDDAAEVAQLLVAAADGVEPHGAAHRWLTAEGTVRWVQWRALQCDEDGRRRGVAQDVTESRVREAALEAVEATTGAGTWYHELGTETVACSLAAHRVLGTDPASYDPHVTDMVVLYGPDGAARFAQAMDRLIEDGSPLDITLRRVSEGPRRRWVRVTGRAIRRHGRTVSLHGTLTDVSEHERAQRRLAHLEELLARADGGIASLSADGRISYANPRFSALLGWPGEDLAGQHLTAFIAHEQQPVVEVLLERLAAGAIEVGDATVGLQRADASMRYVQLNLGGGHDPGGALVEITTLMVDIDDQVRHEQELVRTQAQLHEAQVLAGSGTFRLDLVDGTLWWSPALKRVMGLDETEEPAYAEWLAAIPASAQPHVRQAYQRALEEQAPFEVTHPVVLRSGELRWIEQHGQLRSAEVGGRPALLYGTARDVTDQQQRQQRLLESEERLVRVLEATTDGWWDYRPATGETLYSDRFLALVGATPDELGTLEQAWERLVDDPDGAQRAALERAFSRRQHTFATRHMLLTTNGRRVPALVRAIIDYDARGRPARITGATTDLTEIEQASRAKDHFVAMVSHELRTPLTTLRGVIDTLREGRTGAMSEPADQLLAAAQRNGVRLERLITDLLTFEQLSQPEDLMNRRAVDLSQRMAAVVAEQEYYLDRHGVPARFRGPTDPVTVLADPDRIEQVALNLLTNAAHHATDQSTIEVEVHEDGLVTVDNDGPAIPQAFVEHLFEPFTQAECGDRRRPGGTGLGLAIAQRIVERHGGEIGYRRVDGRTRFWFRLPRTEGPTQPGQRSASRPRRPACPRPWPAGEPPTTGHRLW